MSTLDLKSLRRAFGSFMTGVTIVSTIDEDGVPVGFTANSFSSVSLDPPMLLVCPAKSLSSFDIFNQCAHFHVSILAHDQQATSNVFASNNEDRFAQTAWHKDANGCPSIDGAIASFTCERHQSVDAGDHIILLGTVMDFEAHEKDGLGYGVGGYFSLNMERAAAELQTHSQNDAQHLAAGAIVEHNGKILVIANSESKLSLPLIEVDDEQLAFDSLHEHLEAELGVEINVGQVFSVFDHEKENKSSIYYRVLIEHDAIPQIKHGEFCSIDDLAEQNNFSSEAIASVVKRYITERRSGNHKLYVGTDNAGKTHTMHGSSS